MSLSPSETVLRVLPSQKTIGQKKALVLGELSIKTKNPGPLFNDSCYFREPPLSTSWERPGIQTNKIAHHEILSVRVLLSLRSSDVLSTKFVPTFADLCPSPFYGHFYRVSRPTAATSSSPLESWPTEMHCSGINTPDPFFYYAS